MVIKRILPLLLLLFSFSIAPALLGQPPKGQPPKVPAAKGQSTKDQSPKDPSSKDQAPKPDGDALLVDATYVPCSDSTESLFILRDGRALYASGDCGTAFTVPAATLAELQTMVESAVSTVDRKGMDSCATLGVILAGPRFLLINSLHPTPETRDIQIRLERLRKLGRKKLDESLEKLGRKLDEEADTAIQATPSITQQELERRMRHSPIAQEWRCRGNVIVSAMIGKKGEVRRAFVRDAQVRGKCSSLLTMTALRAVLLSNFQPALKRNGRPASSWIQVEVPFGRDSRMKNAEVRNRVDNRPAE